jgi:hypothetical protein
MDCFARAYRLALSLAPLLERASAAGEDAKTITVLAAGKGGQINTDDLGLAKTYSLTRLMSEGTSYTDCMIQVRRCLLMIHFVYLFSNVLS